LYANVCSRLLKNHHAKAVILVVITQRGKLLFLKRMFVTQEYSLAARNYLKKHLPTMLRKLCKKLETEEKAEHKNGF
jgi:hypothetical protein